MTFVVSLRAFATSASVPRLLALRETDAALATPFVRGIEGFEPRRNEMIFGHAGPSCYSSEPFATFLERSTGGLALAGFAGESSCQSTLIDAFHRKHGLPGNGRLGSGHLGNGIGAGG